MTNPRENMRHTLERGETVFAAPAPEGCPQVFAPCLDPNCERQCGARLDKLPEEARAVNTTQSILYGVAVSLMALSVLAGVGAIAEQGAKNIHAVNIAYSEEAR